MSEMERIDQIRARLDTVSQPWVMEWDGQTLYVNDADGDEIVAQTFAIATWEPEYSGQKAECDTASAALIANAPADIAYLLARIADLEAAQARDAATIATLTGERDRYQQMAMELNEQRNRAVESAEQAYKREDVADAKLAASEQRAALLVEAVQGAAHRICGAYGPCFCRPPQPSVDLGHERACQVLRRALMETRAALAAAAPSAGCHAGNDGDCSWSACPQLRDGEPASSGRHCPLDAASTADREDVSGE